MNEPDLQELSNLANSWSIETQDLRSRVAAAISARNLEISDLAELRAELQSLKREMDELRRSVALLQRELARSRSGLLNRSVRITPYSPSESLIRLS